MKRNIDFNEISDGKTYTANDMVKADCHDCVGCSDCCHGMGESIVLDPYDMYRLYTGLETNFEELMQSKIALNVVDGLILPHLAMVGEQEQCGFLDGQGRCSIHPFRPGICRMFPLGRIYEEDGFSYFLQVHECPATNKGKVKVKKWVDTPNLKQYEAYIMEWHRLLETCQREVQNLTAQQQQVLSMFLLKTFYQKNYEEEFYMDFAQRLQMAKETLGIKSE